MGGLRMVTPKLGKSHPPSSLQPASRLNCLQLVRGALFMADLQGTILHVVQKRCEAEAGRQGVENR
jgi:hypothetical protein